MVQEAKSLLIGQITFKFKKSENVVNVKSIFNSHPRVYFGRRFFACCWLFVCGGGWLFHDKARCARNTFEYRKELKPPGLE